MVTDALVLPFLDEAQELGLKRQRQVAVLSEKKCPAVTGGHPARIISNSVGECALLVSKQLALKQFRRQRWAGDDAEWPPRARAPAVDRFGKFAFARARFAANEHRC